MGEAIIVAEKPLAHSGSHQVGWCHFFLELPGAWRTALLGEHPSELRPEQEYGARYFVCLAAIWPRHSEISKFISFNERAQPVDRVMVMNEVEMCRR
jgi:hypothetical protein